MLCIQDSNLVSDIEGYKPSTNYQLYAEKHINNTFLNIFIYLFY